ncbi:uncharacterized protein LOC130800418 isoform X2 [Amaranthus tricolor]|uniref:uncharacterized protein LOC130800418 isoform X2 n=1 Tax=Amaranthus tricolor TaxID=29722 RepID=UPI00258304B6|nr:uncharacterized protein LOC130800418 isoform X2 [Amaranthus tricolor]
MKHVTLVQELHRIYRKQKELMRETKNKEPYVDDLHFEIQSSNLSSAKISARYGQNTLYSVPLVNSHTTPSLTGRDNIQTSLYSVHELRTPTSPFASRNGGTLNDLDVVKSKCKKIGGKLLDLELPAEVYVDSDEEDFLHPSTPVTLLSDKRSKAVVEAIVLPSTASRSLKPVLEGELRNLADLNEPLALSYTEECDWDKRTEAGRGFLERNLDLSDSRNIMSITSIVKSENAKSDLGFASFGSKLSNVGQNPPVVQALPSVNSQLSSCKGAKILGKLNAVLNNRINANRHCSLDSDVAKHITRPVAAEFESFDKRKRCRMIDINLPCDLTTDEESLVYENSGQIDLNFCLNIDLEAPISPEVEERLPTRGDSEEIQPEEGNDLFVKLAAETIVSISSRFVSCSKSTNLQKPETLDSGNLEWFAGVISSLSVDLDKDLETMRCRDTCTIDDFEVMTLQLTETKEEKYWCKDSVQILSETCSMLLPSKTRRGRTRRSKTKDFHREVLPSLASLSRYEITEDMQMIEGLMEAAGTPWPLNRTRRTCRMGRKSRLAKQVTFVEEVPEIVELMALVSWGKVNRRSIRRRCPARPTARPK